VFTCKNIGIASWCESYIKQQKSSAFIEKHLLNPTSTHPVLANLVRVD